VNLELSIGDSDADRATLGELGDWLRDEFELRGRVRMVSRPPEPGRMGAVADTLSVALAGGGAISVLAASLRVWFAQPKRSDIRVTIRTARGDVVEIDAKRVVDAEAILSSALALRPTEDDQGASA
jgi:hypothetical protein